MRYVIVVLSFVVFVLVPTPRHANAEVVTWAFTGEIDGIFDYDNVFGGTVTVGLPFTSLISFDTETPDGDPDPQFGLYIGTITLAEIEIADLIMRGPIVPSAGGISVSNGVPGSHDSFSFGTQLAFGGDSIRFLLGLGRLGADALLTDELISIPPTLNPSIPGFLTLSSETPGSSFWLGGPLESVRVIPEPTSGLLLWIVCTLRLYRKRRNRFSAKDSS